MFALLTIYGISKRHDKLGFDYLPHVSLPAGIVSLTVVFTYVTYIGALFYSVSCYCFLATWQDYCYAGVLLTMELILEEHCLDGT